MGKHYDGPPRSADEIQFNPDLLRVESEESKKQRQKKAAFAKDRDLIKNFPKRRQEILRQSRNCSPQKYQELIDDLEEESARLEREAQRRRDALKQK